MRYLVFLLLIYNNNAFSGGKKKKCRKVSPAHIEKIAKQAESIGRSSFSAKLKDHMLFTLKKGRLFPQEFLDKAKLNVKFTPKNFVSLRNLDIHYSKHKEEFKVNSMTQYMQRATNFANDKVADTISSRASDGTWTKLNPHTGEFIVLDSTGENVITYYKAELRIKNQQIQNYNSNPKNFNLPKRKSYVSLMDWYSDVLINGRLGQEIIE